MPSARTLGATLVLALGCMVTTHAQVAQPGTAPASKQGAGAVLPPVPELAEANRLLRRGAHADALATVDKYLRTNQRDINALFLRGVVLAEAKRTDEAIVAFRTLADANPDLSEPHNNLAVLYASQGRLDQARTALEQAVSANPENATALENLGDIYLRLAAESYEKSVRLDAANRSARTKLGLARELVGKPIPATNAGERKE